MFRLTTVGTGCAIPRLQRRASCLLVEADKTRIVVDLGMGALHGLLAAGVDHHGMDALLLTHLHPDHTGELVSFFFAANYDLPPRSRPLTLSGGTGLRDFLDGLGRLYGKWVEPQHHERAVKELRPHQGFAVGPVTVQTAPACHSDESVGYRFDFEGKAAAVTGDTGPCRALEELAEGVELLVAECSLPEGYEMEGHLTARQAGELAQRAGAKQLLLTHFYPQSEADRPAEQAAETFTGKIKLAQDGLAVEV